MFATFYAFKKKKISLINIYEGFVNKNNYYACYFFLLLFSLFLSLLLLLSLSLLLSLLSFIIF